ncbi:MAG: four-helix bundle copper-binding protein [Actinobacteria bacterium]|nr:four-helix bundle copper-binding protein [Actinomycetota bacterium]
MFTLGAQRSHEMTSTTMPMLQTYPQPINLDRRMLASAIDTLIGCAEACTACADACLSEPNVADLTKCIRTNLDCADICQTTGRVVSRQTEYDANVTRAIVEACVQSCKSCGDECEQHGEAGMGLWQRAGDLQMQHMQARAARQSLNAPAFSATAPCPTA